MPRRRRAEGERGAAAVIMGVGLTLVLVLIAAFAVDLGMQRTARRDMQALADVVALDLARNLDGRTKSALASTMDAAKAKSLERNSDTVGDTPELSWELGKMQDGEFVSVGGGDIPTAVKVTADTSVDFAFGGVTGVASGDAGREAVATKSDPSVCVTVGTKTLTLDTSGSVLGPLLENTLGGILDVDLDVIGYNGIVDLKNVYVPLADLLVELNVGSTDEVVGTNVSLADLAIAMANVATRNGDTAAATVLEAIGAHVEDLDIALGDILALQSGQDASGLGANINALDLLGAAVFAADGEHALGATLPGYLTVTAIEPPQIACGRGDGTTTARSAQIRLAVDIPNLLQAATNLGIPVDSFLVSAKAKLELNVGYATARIDEIECSGGRVRLQVDTGAAEVHTVAADHITLAITLAKFFDAAGPLIGGLLKIALQPLLGPDVGLKVEAGASIGSSAKNRWINYPPAPAVPDPIRFPESDSQRKTLHLTGVNVQLLESASVLGLLAGVLNPVLSGLLGSVVQPLLNTTLSPLLDVLVHPVLESLGIGLGVADVSVGDRPVCQGIKLVG